MKTKSLKDMINNIVWLLIDKVFLLVFNLIILFVVANHYGPDTYGVFQYALNIVLILEVILQLIDGRVVKKQYEEENNDEVVLNVNAAKLFLSGITLLLGQLIIIFSKDSGKEFSIIIFILLINSVIKNLRFGMENRFEYILESKKVVIASNVGLCISLLLQLTAVYFNASIIFLSLIQFCSTSINYILLRSQYKRTFKKDNRRIIINRNMIYTIIKESLPLALASAAATIYTKCDAVMLGILLSPTEVGIYSIASKFINTIQIFLTPVQTSIFVKMLEWYKNPEEYRHKYIYITSMATWFAIAGIMLSYIVLPYIFKLLKPAYVPAIKAYQILTVGSLFAYNAILRSSHFTITGNGKILMIVQFYTAGINMILNIFFIRKFGMCGAAMATSIAQIISLFISNIFFQEARCVFKYQLKGFNPFNMMKR